VVGEAGHSTAVNHVTVTPYRNRDSTRNQENPTANKTWLTRSSQVAKLAHTRARMRPVTGGLAVPFITRPLLYELTHLSA
jgi:hypothetical protein